MRLSLWTVLLALALAGITCAAQSVAWTASLESADESAELAYGTETIAVAETIGLTVQLRVLGAATGKIVFIKRWTGKPGQTPGERRPQIYALDSAGWLVLIENRLTLLDRLGNEVRAIEFERRTSAADYNPTITLRQALILTSNGREAAVLAFEQNRWPGRLYWINVEDLQPTEEKMSGPWPFLGSVSMTNSGEVISTSREGGFKLKSPQAPIKSLCSSCKEIQWAAEAQAFDGGLIRTYVKGKKPVAVFRGDKLLWATGCTQGEQPVRIVNAANSPTIALLCSRGFGFPNTVAYGEVGAKKMQTFAIPSNITKQNVGGGIVRESEITPRISLSPAGDRLLVLQWPQRTLTSYRIAAH